MYSVCICINQGIMIDQYLDYNRYPLFTGNARNIFLGLKQLFNPFIIFHFCFIYPIENLNLMIGTQLVNSNQNWNRLFFLIMIVHNVYVYDSFVGVCVILANTYMSANTKFHSFHVLKIKKKRKICLLVS